MDGLDIGIDLGVASSRVCWYIDGYKNILSNTESGTVIPSVMYFHPEGHTLEDCIIGNEAKNLPAKKVENYIYGLKHLIGRKFDDFQIQERIKYFSFDVSGDVSNSIEISFTQNGKLVTTTPQQLLTIYLKKLKTYFEEHMKMYYKKTQQQRITKVVITVPAYFNGIQRKAIFTAAEDAGFTVSKLISEPTATVLSYKFYGAVYKSSLILVYNMGAGPFEATVVDTRRNSVKMIATSGETELCGQDFDNCVMNCIHENFMALHNYDARNNFSVRKRLLGQCERAKRGLTLLHEVKIPIKQIVPGRDEVEVIVTRQTFLKMSCPLLNKSIQIVDTLLKNSNLPKEFIKEVILTGSSSRMPAIQQRISQYFGREILNNKRTGVSVAEGAGLQAAILSKNKIQTIEEFIITDIVPLPLGFGHCGRMLFIIRKNAQIPTQASWSFYNTESDQTKMSLKIFEGERVDCRDNRFLGKLIIENLTPAPANTVEVTVTLRIDSNGILTVAAYENTHKKHLNVNFNTEIQNS